jgi:fibronectin type 3 domain-containing protein
MFLTMPKTTVKAVKTGITVTWTQSTGATSYEVYRAEYNKKTKKYSGYKKVVTAKSTAKSYTDKTAKKGVKYKYTVKAVNGKVASAYNAVVVSR